jgi:hypothetical protein
VPDANFSTRAWEGAHQSHPVRDGTKAGFSGHFRKQKALKSRIFARAISLPIRLRDFGLST